MRLSGEGMRKITAISTILFLTFLAVYAFAFSKKDAGQLKPAVLPKREVIQIAACPTCYELVKNLDSEKYQVVPTNSTAQSIALWRKNHVDLVVAGRTLRPEEPDLEEVVIREGYSFLGSQETVVYVDELDDIELYTDLDVEKLKIDLAINNINKVDNVYEYLDKGVVVTSWDNTDYTKAAIVQVLEKNGKRASISRQPTIYSSSDYREAALEIAVLIN